MISEDSEKLLVKIVLQETRRNGKAFVKWCGQTGKTQYNFRSEGEQDG